MYLDRFLNFVDGAVKQPNFYLRLSKRICRNSFGILYWRWMKIQVFLYCPLLI